MSDLPPTPSDEGRRGTATLVQLVKNAWTGGAPKRARDVAVWWSIKAVREVGYPIVSAMLSMALVWAIIFRLPTQIEKALDVQQKAVTAAVSDTGKTVADALRTNADSMKDLAQTSRKVELGTEVAQALAANRYKCTPCAKCPTCPQCPDCRCPTCSAAPYLMHPPSTKIPSHPLGNK